MTHPIPATILSGFLGAGKTTLLRRILDQSDEKIAVIENEFGQVPIDSELLGDRASRITTLSNGCICCSSANELAEALLSLLDGIEQGSLVFSRLIIECTGLADPGPVIQTFFSQPRIAQGFMLDGVVTLVDAVHADSQLSAHPVAQAQVGYADRLLLTKTDVAADSQLLIERLQRINARAPITAVVNGQLAMAQLFGVEGFVLNDRLTLSPPRFRPLPVPENSIGSLVLALEQPLALADASAVMEALLTDYADQLLRYKGILSIADEPRRLLFQGVQRLYSADWDRPWREQEQRHSLLVFIGANLPEQVIRERFAAWLGPREAL